MFYTFLIPRGGGSDTTSKEKGPYEVWKETHPQGTPQEFLDAMKGEVTSNVLIQSTPPEPSSIKADKLWVQFGIGPDGKGITLNLIRKK